MWRLNNSNWYDCLLSGMAQLLEQGDEGDTAAVGETMSWGSGSCEISITGVVSCREN